jgi:DNA-binding ferritin-like protein (Dps family)
MIETLSTLPLVSREDEKTYKEALKSLEMQLADIKGLTVGDDVANVHAQLVKAAKQAVDKFTKNLTIASFI